MKFAILGFIVVCFLGALRTGLADERGPGQCESAVSYQGKPLHAGVPDRAWSEAQGSLDGTLDTATQVQLNEAVDWILKEAKAPGIAAAVGVPNKGLWSTMRGYEHSKPPVAVTEQSYFYWASCGKAFTALAVLQLVEEKKLTLDAPLSRWYPKYPNASTTTIEHLLNHTNGTFSFQADKKLREKKGYTPPEELIQIAARHGNLHCPGERWSYSNTGYVLLGRIVEQIEGKPFHQVLTDKIIVPLGLKHTVALAPQQNLAGLAVGHGPKGPDTDFHFGTPFAAGNIVASAEDIVRFWHAVLNGKLLPQATIKNSFARLYPMFDAGTHYGYGVMLYEFKDKEGKTVNWIGHSGGTETYKAMFAYDVNKRAYVAVAVNSAVPAEACANKLFAALSEP